MDAQKLQVKVFADGTPPALEAFIPVFHEWIKHRRLGSELLVDVANYAHVPKGPGVGIVGHASDYFLDLTDGRAGLLYSRKRQAPAEGERLADAFGRAVNAAALLEKEAAFAGKLRFRTDELLFRINDRLGAPNTEETFAAVRPELDALCGKLFGAGYKLSPAARPRELFAVKIATDGKLSLAALLDRLGGAPA
jgi:hypothetical protein